MTGGRPKAIDRAPREGLETGNGANGSPGLAEGPVCPTPAPALDRVQLGHGSGGTMGAALLRERFLPRFANPWLERLGDGAVLPVHGGAVAVSTDTFVVRPLEFPGGCIGDLAVNGTLNDVAMMGANPAWLSAGFVLEEGLDFAVLDRVLDAMARAAADAGVPIVTGDTKVVDRGSADGLYINTTGIGTLRPDFLPRPDAAEPGDAVLVSGPLGRHGIAVMSVREGLGFEAEVVSDTACLAPLVRLLEERVGGGVRTLRDPTRGGLASALNEVAAASGVGIELDGEAIPVPVPVAAACDMLGLDPLYVANEGVLMAVVEPACADAALDALRAHPLGAEAALIGTVTRDHGGLVTQRTGFGGRRIVDMLSGDQLPRIC
ncbi:MAG TPA: hydrogenase expression/formation protein HypE [Longimicrobiales bacterium]|nr:hydrogenase expression/formation protein HypE [Longimicrobiales bacterium]